ncbi:phosphatidylinositol 3-kinase [Malassezia sp. CBS 17886]|nr:phosphatidylinositol 3-kinase [Malassezia sp. CBS 17886]
MDRDFYSFVAAHDVRDDVRVCIRGALEGELPRVQPGGRLADPQTAFRGVVQTRHPPLCVECTLYADNLPLGIPQRTHPCTYRDGYSTPHRLADDAPAAWLTKQWKQHEGHAFPHDEWLDALALQRMDHMHKTLMHTDASLLLTVELPSYELPVVFAEAEPSFDATPPVSVTAIDASLFTVVDPDGASENVAEAKHRRLVRRQRSGALDRDRKPTAAVRDELQRILRYPPTRVLTAAEKDLIWSFRFYLSRFSNALTKFLKSTVWSDLLEARQATEVLLPIWAEPELSDALELLGPSFRDPRVRTYAVQQLQRADDEELALYLLQLVQALKFDEEALEDTPLHGNGAHAGPSARRREGFRGGERVEDAAAAGEASAGEESASGDAAAGTPRHAAPATPPPRLSDFLAARSAHNATLGTMYYWYVAVESEDPRYGTLYRRVAKSLDRHLASESPSLAHTIARQQHFVCSLVGLAREVRLSRDARPGKIEKLRIALADRKTLALPPPLPLPLDPSVCVGGVVPEESTVFKSNLFPLRVEFLTAGDDERHGSTWGPAGGGGPFSALDAESNTLENGARPSVRGPSPGATVDAGATHVPAAAQPPAPGDASTAPSTYTVIVKHGDDLRQDQLVIQLFTLMDRLMRNENLDLRITPYHVLATGPTDGLVQFVPSMSIAAIMAQYGSLIEYLRVHFPDNTSAATFHVQASVLDTFVRSCAGYCVITYILGIGDRHLDNLLLAPDGHFFHVDFGYILGQDPKPFPPPVKVCKEMVDAMGGTSSVYYVRFMKLCHTSFTCLRKNANLILNLVALMVDANIPDIRAEPDKAVLKIQEKFLLDVPEENAVAHLETLLNETSYFSSMFDRLHNMAQYFRQ